jgi:hypothetical protein
MRKILFVVAILLGFGVKAHAYQESYDKGYSTWVVTGVICTTGTSVEVSTAIAGGYNIGTYRFINQDGADAVWLGPLTNVSTTATNGNASNGYNNLGEKIVAGGSGTWDLGRDGGSSAAKVKIWCMAEDAAGGPGAVLSRAIFGYK